MGDKSTAGQGLEDVVVTTSDICFIDGKKGTLVYRGYDIRELVEGGATFEETAYLLLNGRLPKRAELDEFTKAMAGTRALPKEVLKIMQLLAHQSHPMELLRTVTSILSSYDPDRGDMSIDAMRRRALRLVAQFPTIIATFDHMRNNRDPVTPDPDLSHAANFLYMLRDERPDKYEARVFDVCLILHAEHELNASTFASRVTASTLAGMFGAVTSAVGTLRGPLHGGANEEVMKMLIEVDSVEKAEPWIKQAFADKRKVMGFGHRVYKTDDPRATFLREYSRELGKRKQATKWFEISQRIEQVVKSTKTLYPNVDFYSASTYTYLGIPRDLFTPIFAASRVSGWCAHILEQYQHNRIIRPTADYTGPQDLKYVPVDERK